MSVIGQSGTDHDPTTAGITSSCESSWNAGPSYARVKDVVFSSSQKTSSTVSQCSSSTPILSTVIGDPCEAAATTVTCSQLLPPDGSTPVPIPSASTCSSSNSTRCTLVGDTCEAANTVSCLLPPPVANTRLTAVDLWDIAMHPPVNPSAVAQTVPRTKSKSTKKTTNLTVSEVRSAKIEPTLPFCNSDIMEGFEAPVKPVLKTGSLKPCRFVLPGGKCFMDRELPRPTVPLVEHTLYNATYFINLHHRSIAPGQRGQYKWKEGTPNYLGARIPLEHTTFNLPSWRKHLIGYDGNEVLQFLEFGFPLGLDNLPTLSPALANHGSAYQYYPWLDKFFAGGLIKGGVTGPCGSAPFSNPMVSPLMTAFKKPSDRRAVYDASFGQYSLNNSTPGDHYLGEKCLYTYPKVEDFQRLILICGRGCLMWKRDLARYYLQLPLDPTEYCHTGAIWRGLFFFFIALMFGLRHSGLQGQKVTDALAWVHRNNGLEYIPPAPPLPTSQAVQEPDLEMRNSAIVPNINPDRPLPYKNVNYSDDLAGCETSLHKADASFQSLGNLMQELGLVESTAKACSPSTKMVFLGVHFDHEHPS